MHPAGPKVLTLVEREFGLGAEELAASLEGVAPLREHVLGRGAVRPRGNDGEAARMRPGDLGIIVAFGPGMSGEIVLARWEA